MKRIRLTEGQLHRLIEQTLNELDWKTYMNAAKGAQDRIQDDPFYDEDATDAEFDAYRKNYSRVPNFIDAARDSYQKKYDSERKDSFESYNLGNGKGINPYNYERTYGDDYGENEELPDDDFWYSQTQTFFPETKDIPDDDFTDTDLTVNSKYGEQNDWAVFDEPYRNVVDTDDRNVNLSKTSPEFRDVYNYRHGNSKYTKGKGWNESVARRVTESVVRKLNEGWSASFNLANYGSPSNYYMPQSLQDIVDYYCGTNVDGSSDDEIIDDVMSALEKLPKDRKLRCIEDLYDQWDIVGHDELPQTFKEAMQDLALYPKEVIDSLDHWASVVAVPVYNTLINDYGYERFCSDS